MTSLPPAHAVLDRLIQDQETPFAEKPDPCYHNPKGRIIVISADGTSNKFGNKSTNVVEFHSRVVKDEDQITLYLGGIGTYADNKLQALLDMAVATTFDRNVFKAYEWLSENYKEGDRIYLFGFSRGAYQVRVLAGMIERVGLLHKGNYTHIPSAFKLYKATTEKSSISKVILQKLGISRAIKTNVELGIIGKEPGAKMKDLGTPLQKSKEMCAIFKKAFSREVKVHFVGVWDTVSSVGVTSGFDLPETVDGMTHVCHFRQALALDERRVRFWPEYADRLAYRPLAPGEGLRADVKEVWFAGSHSDVGGYKLNEKLSQFSPALRWMTYEAVAHGLQMTPFGGEWNDNKPQTNSLKGLWHIPELLPVLHPDHLSDESSQRFHRTRKLHFAAPRRIFEGQRIHESVLAAMLNRTWNYRPTACFHDGENRWADALESHEFVNTWLERDPITSAQRFVEQIRTGMREWRDDPTSIITTLEGYTSSPMRLRSLAEVKDVVSALTNHLLFPELERPGDGNSTGPRKDMYYILFSILISIPPTENDKISISRLRDLVSRLHLPYGPDLNIRQPSRDIILRHGDGRLSTKPHQCHSSQVLFIAVSENDQCIFSASSTEMTILCLKNLSHPAQIPFRSEEPIKSVAISADGQYLALGSSIAGVETRRLNLLDHATGHREILTVSRARRVAFSPDGLKIAAALDDCTIKIYNRISADDPAIRILIGHRDWIRSLAFSRNGYYLVSGSDDCTIRVWDVSADNPGQQTVTPVKMINSGQGVVRTVAVHLEYQTGPNEETEGDRTIQPTRNTVLGNHQLNPDASIQGPHIAEINTFEDTTSVFPRVARTPAPRPYTPALTIISGSDDGSICIHREGPEGFMKTEKLEERHSTWIRCVAISRSGDMIASASDDCTIRCWEVKAEKGTKTVAKYHTKSAVCSLAFSKDGKKLVTGNYLGEVQVWDADVLL